MKVVVILEIEVDPKAYNDEYGLDLTAVEIRDNVKEDAADAALMSFYHIPRVVKNVKLRNRR